MIWLTWRQFRTAAAAVFAVLIAFAALLAVTGPDLAGDYAAGMADCTAQGGDCEDFINRFLNEYQSLALGVTAIGLVVPALIGLFWGAPLISRELEAGTHRLVWNQSITRGRWLTVKLGLTGLAAIAAAALGTVAVTWWSRTIDQVPGNEFTPLGSWVFDARGVVPVGYAVFALVLGVTVGMLIRRILAAMAVTLTAFIVVQLAMPTLVRPHLLPPTQTSAVISESIVDDLMRNPDSGVLRLTAKAPEEGWLLSSRTVDASGNAVEEIQVPMTSGPCAPSSSMAEGMTECFGEIERLGYRQELTYHPASRFWPLQWIETGIYAALALGLAGFCFWWIRRRLS